MNKKRRDEIAYFWAYKLLPDYIRDLEESANEQEDYLIKDLLNKRLEEVKKDYEIIRKALEENGI